VTTPLDQTPAEALATLTAWVRSRGLPAYRAGQIHRRLWIAPGASWSLATELPAALRSAVPYRPAPQRGHKTTVAR